MFDMRVERCNTYVSIRLSLELLFCLSVVSTQLNDSVSYAVFITFMLILNPVLL